MDALRVAVAPRRRVRAFDATWTVIDRLFEFAEAALAPATPRSNPAARVGASPRTRGVTGSNPIGGAARAPRAPPTPWAPTFSSEPRLFRAGRVRDERPTIDAFAEPTENRPSCASGFLSRTPRWTPDVCVLPRHVDRTLVIRTTRTTPDPPRESREEAPRYDSPRARAESASGGAGSVCAWAGQTVHWGGSCRLREDDDTYEGENPGEDGLIKIRHARGGTRTRRGARGRARARAASKRGVHVRSRAGEFACGGALPLMTRAECAALDVAGRARLIAQSLVLYSRWYDLPAFLPGVLEDGEGF